MSVFIATAARCIAKSRTTAGTCTRLRWKGSSSPKRTLQLLHERGGRDWKNATSSSREQQSRLQQRRIDQWKRDHVSRRDQRFAWATELEADTAIHMGEGFHRLDRVRNQTGVEIERGGRQNLLDQDATGHAGIGPPPRERQANAQ